MSTHSGDQEVKGDRVGHIEVRGMDPIPDADAHGNPRELYWLWLTSNMTFFYILVGGLLVMLGMTLWQALLVIALGGLSNFLIGLQAVPGPVARTPTMIISRAQYGLNGNRFSAFLGWFNLVAYEAIGLSICSFAMFALAEFAGWQIDDFGKAVLMAILIAVSFTTAIFGHATIVWFQKIFAYLFLGMTVLLFIFVLPDVDWSYSPSPALDTSAAIAVASVGITIMFSSNLAWTQSPADFSRYLPRGTSPRSIFLNTSLGILTASTLLLVLGALAATAVDMTDPLVSLKELMPGWAYVFFLLVVIGGTAANVILSAYSSGLNLQALGITIPRYKAVWLDAALGSAMTVYAVFFSNFLTTLGEFLQLMIVWYAPFCAIFIVDWYLRRFRYDGQELHDRNGRFWYDGGVNWRGVIALLAGMAAAFLCVNTAHWQSPFSKSFEGADISALIGLAVGGALYWLLMRRHIVEPAMTVTSTGIPSIDGVPDSLGVPASPQLEAEQR